MEKFSSRDAPSSERARDAATMFARTIPVIVRSLTKQGRHGEIMCDLPSVFSDTIRRARKDHKCCECRRIIKSGERYHLSKGCWEHKWYEFKTCTECDELREELRTACDLYPDEGPAFGELGELAHESGVEFPVVSA